MITDYINQNLTAAIPNNLNKLNTQAFILSLNENVTRYYKEYKRFKICDTDIINFKNCSNAFCDQLIVGMIRNNKEYKKRKFSDLTSRAAQAPVKSIIYLASITRNLEILKAIAKNIVTSYKCLWKASDIVRNNIRVHFLSDQVEKRKLL